MDACSKRQAYFPAWLQETGERDRWGGLIEEIPPAVADSSGRIGRRDRQVESLAVSA